MIRECKELTRGLQLHPATLAVTELDGFDH